MKEFAAYLRHAREARGVSLDAIQRQSRIRMQYLVAMEDGRFEELPETTYVRAFLKHYASVVGLNAEEVLQRYEDARAAAGLAVPERTTAMPLAEESRSERRQRQLQARRRKRRMQWVGLLVIIATLVLLRWLDPLSWFNKDDGLQNVLPAGTITGSAVDETASADVEHVPSLSVAIVVEDDNTDSDVGDDEVERIGHSDGEGSDDATVPAVPEQETEAMDSVVDRNRATSGTEPMPQYAEATTENVMEPGEVGIRAEQLVNEAEAATGVEGEHALNLNEARRVWYEQTATLMKRQDTERVDMLPYPGADEITITLHPIDEAWTELTVDDRRVVYRVLQPGEEVTYTFTASAQLRLGRAESTLVTLGSEPVGRLGAGIVSKNLIVSGVE